MDTSENERKSIEPCPPQMQADVLHIRKFTLLDNPLHQEQHWKNQFIDLFTTCLTHTRWFGLSIPFLLNMIPHVTHHQL